MKEEVVAKKEGFLLKHGEFFSLAAIILGGFYFTTTHLSHSIDRVEDRVIILENRVNGVEKEVYAMKGMMTYAQNDRGEK